MELTKQNKIAIFATIGMCMIAWITTFLPKTKEIEWYERQLKIFDSTYLNGRITNVHPNAGVVVLELDNNEHKFIFDPDDCLKNGHRYIFDLIADAGDSIVKPPFCDSLVLFHKGQQYSFRFRKPSIRN